MSQQKNGVKNFVWFKNLDLSQEKRKNVFGKNLRVYTYTGSGYFLFSELMNLEIVNISGVAPIAFVSTSFIAAY